MRPLFNTSHYASADWFATESQAIFQQVWLLAAIQPMLARHLDYRTLTIAGIPLVLQNHAGVIRAFANICRHRMARIQNEEFGNRPLVCPYHHWCYDGEGKLQHTHRDPAIFGLTAQEKAEIRLREFQVRTVGSLVFVNLADDPMPIEQQFDADMLQLLASTTASMDSSYVYTRYNAAFNWKTGIENIRDALHVECLHKATMPDYIEFGASSDTSAARHYTQRHAQALPPDLPLQQASIITGHVPMQQSPVLEWKSLVEQLHTKDHYTSIHLFPNVNLMLVDGTSFAIQIYNPLAADSTEMQMMVALTRPVQEFAYKPVVLWEHLVSDMKVLQEDIDCLEALQRNLQAAQHEVIHGDYETSILDFQAACLAQVARATA